MAVVQCPVCDLRFSSEADLDDHLASDHPDFSSDPVSDVDKIRKEMGRRHPLEP